MPASLRCGPEHASDVNTFSRLDARYGQRIHIAHDVLHRLQGLEFVWNIHKAVTNAAKHGIRFEQACEAFLDPFAQTLNAGVREEARDALIGESERGHLLFVVHIEREGEAIRIISARQAIAAERRSYENHV